MECKWSFINNGGGSVIGVADSGIETFLGNKLASLIRENCQNSLDAVDDENLAVRIEIYRHKIASSNIPGHADYINAIDSCEQYWSDKSVKAKETIDKAKATIGDESISVLRFSDYNTLGLAGPYAVKQNADGWNSLVKTAGGAQKSGDTGGSFGIGKYAPFCNSSLRLVFYRTFNIAGETAVQGVSKLMSFSATNDDYNITAGIGFFGVSNNNNHTPVENLDLLDEIHKRNEVGTDIFTYGFCEDEKTWVDTAICIVLENFMMSIYKRKLSISIQDEEITWHTLDKYIEKYKNKIKNAYWYYQAIVSEERSQTQLELHNMGKVKLSLLINHNEKLPKKVLITRKSGMKLFELSSISKFYPFCGVLEMEGLALNNFFREMENPTHDNWLTSRHNNPKLAKEYYEEIKRWIKSELSKFGEDSSGELIEVEGVGSVLQGELKSQNSKNSNKMVEELDDNIKKIVITRREINTPKVRSFLIGGNGTDKSNKREKVAGTIDKDGTDPAIRGLSGTRKRSKKESHKGVENPEGKDVIQKNKMDSKTTSVEKIRVIKIGDSKYRLSFVLPKSIDNGHIEIVTVGENGQSYRLNISSAEGVSGCTNICCAKNGINFSNILKGDRVQINYKLYDTREYAMEVRIYEDK